VQASPETGEQLLALDQLHARTLVRRPCTGNQCATDAREPRAVVVCATSGCTSRKHVIPDRIEREILIHAPVDVVWAVVTEPGHISGWFSDAVELELHPGGRADLYWDSHGTVHGRVERVEPPHFFSFRWMMDAGRELSEDNSTLVEFSLSAEGESTRLTVVETGFRDLAVPDGEKRAHFDSHNRGWDSELNELREYAERKSAAPAN
jgi:uncharacterized protein YndB with AHSA1/START domain